MAEAAVVAVEGHAWHDDEVHARVERVLPTIVARRLGDAPVRAGKRVNVRHGEGLDHGHVSCFHVLDARQEDALVGGERGLEDRRRIKFAGHAAEGADLRGAFPIVPRKEALGDAGALALDLSSWQRSTDGLDGPAQGLFCGQDFDHIELLQLHSTFAQLHWLECERSSRRRSDGVLFSVLSEAPLPHG